MLKHKGFVKGVISFGLSLAMVVTSLSAVASAEERTPTVRAFHMYIIPTAMLPSFATAQLPHIPILMTKTVN